MDAFILSNLSSGSPNIQLLYMGRAAYCETRLEDMRCKQAFQQSACRNETYLTPQSLNSHHSLYMCQFVSMFRVESAFPHTHHLAVNA